MANNIAVSITADVADLTAKRAILSSELKAATADLNNFAKTARTSGMTDELRTSMLASADGVAKARNQIKALDGELKGLSEHSEGDFLAKTLGGLKTASLDSATEKLGVFGRGVEALGPIAIAAGAAFAVLDFAVDKAMEGAEWAEQLKRASATLGLTTTQLQEFDFVFNAMGTDVAKGRETLASLEKTIGLVESGLARSTQVKTFTDALKITPEDLRGWGTLEEQLPHIIDALAKLDPEERAAAASRLKVDPEVITSLIEERERIGELIDEAHQYGIVISADVVDKSAEASGKMREWKAVIDGELRTAFLELAPVIAGAAQAVAGASRDFADFVKGVEHVTAPIANFVRGVSASIAGVRGLSGAVSELVHFVDPVSRLVDLMSQIGRADRQAEDKANTAHEQNAPPAPKPVELSTPKPKTHGPDQVEVWRNQLQQQQIASNDFFKDNLQSELTFWQAKLAATQKGSKDQLAVQTEIFNVQKQLAHQAYDEQIATLNDKIAADKDNYAKAQADRQTEFDYIKSVHGATSTEALNFQREMVSAEREYQDQIAQAKREGSEKALQELRQNLDAQTQLMETQANTAKTAVAARGKTSITGPLGDVSAAQQEAAIDRQTDQQKMAAEESYWAAQSALLDKGIADAQAKYGQDVIHYQAAVNAKAAAEQQFQNKITQMQAQMVSQQQQDQMKIQQAWTSAITPLVDSFGNGIKGMIEGTENLRTAVRGIADTILSVVISAIERWIAAQIVAAITGQTTGVTSAKAQVTALAGLAGAGGVASMAAAPFPLDLGAAAFGASMTAAALAFGAFDKGMDVVPNDMIAQIHEGERIVPASDNAAMIAAMNGGGAGASSRSGDVNLNYSPTVHGGGSTLAELLQREGRTMTQWVRTQHRNGAFRV